MYSFLYSKLFSPVIYKIKVSFTTNQFCHFEPENRALQNGPNLFI
ncbi:hypothetical protein A1343_12190 [Leptospira interrogans serovar Bataviae]|nr:hypothetical protein LEP1GSC111_4497 [Leptospira interrogans str. UT126]MCR8649279.1 hypothetical protein [Leptospira interrogans serovar Bataviae]OAM72327.1 hypothetical protein A1343_12190 [Leptospira interrogans serovar Bataviae]